MPVAVPNLLTVQMFVQKHPAFTAGGLRWLLFHRQENGLSRAVVRCGRKLLIDEEEFFSWLSEQQNEERAGNG